MLVCKDKSVQKTLDGKEVITYKSHLMKLKPMIDRQTGKKIFREVCSRCGYTNFIMRR